MVSCNVTQTVDAKSALDKTIEAFGRLYSAFNNAGIGQPVIATGEITEQEWDRIVAVNLGGVFLAAKLKTAEPVLANFEQQHGL